MNHFRVLTLSGGGVRGVFQSEYLSRLFAGLGGKVTEHFDLIAGTSTGAIVAVAAALGVDMSRVSEFYINHAHTLFTPRTFAGVRQGPRYDQQTLRQHLQTIFGSAQLRDLNMPVVIPAVSLADFTHKVFSNDARISGSDGSLPVVDVLLASAAAPTYFAPVTFPAHRCAYLDGGMWANSPSLVAILCCHNELGVPLDDLRLVTVGNGNFPSGFTAKDLMSIRPVSLGAIRLVFELMSTSQSSFADGYAAQLLGRNRAININATLNKRIALDEVAPALEKLPALAETAASNSLEQVRDLLTDRAADAAAVDVGTAVRPEYVTAENIAAAGLTGLFPSRAFYATHRHGAATIDQYAARAQRSLIFVSVNLMTGVPFDGICQVLETKLSDAAVDFRACISLLDPRRSDLMSAMAPVFEHLDAAVDLSNEIKKTLKQLFKFRATLSSSGQERFELRLHQTIPAGSAILIDHDEPNGRIQVESKPYKAPMRASFAIEVAPTGSRGLYEALVDGYTSLVRDGVAISSSDFS